jgi:hypothetical protein
MLLVVRAQVLVQMQTVENQKRGVQERQRELRFCARGEADTHALELQELLRRLVVVLGQQRPQDHEPHAIGRLQQVRLHSLPLLTRCLLLFSLWDKRVSSN